MTNVVDITQRLLKKRPAGHRLTKEVVRAILEDADIIQPLLTPRQREVLLLLVEGHSMKGAGRILDVTARTVAYHKYRMMEHLDLKTDVDLFRFAIRQGIVPGLWEAAAGGIAS